MTETIANYDPNNRWGDHLVEVTLRRWGYSLTYATKVGGNCQGFNVIESAISNLIEDDEFVEEGEDGLLSILLKDAEGKGLLCEDDDERGEEWLKAMIVECRIVGFEPEKKSAKAA